MVEAPANEVLESTLDVALSLLSNPVRRGAIDVLDARTEPLTLSELAAELRTSPELSSDRPESRRLQVVLHHVHLPTLAAHGAVEYDATDRRVALTTFGRRLSDVGDAVRRALA